MTEPDFVLCRIEDTRWADLGLEPLAVRAATATLDHLSYDPDSFEISLLGTDDTRIAELNGQFRGKPTPTNVLSWPSEERGADTDGGAPYPPEDEELGDIALAWETCVREAAEAGKPMSDHVTHLVVHGLLHLLGYDHERDADATLMERIETEILATLGVPNPY
ncbi:MAG: rRNA maturation RNase YbeY [Paracoccaceae bacterium]